MANNDVALAKIVRRRAARVYPLDMRSAKIVIEFIDNSITELPVFLGKSSAVTRDKSNIEKDVSAKQKLLQFAPGKDEIPVTMKRLIRDAGLRWNAWNRNKIWELCEEGELICLRKEFRKAK